MRRVLLGLVRLYRRHISQQFGPCCKYYPTCSTYALTCIDRHGAVKGTLLSLWRWIRCNPMSDGGVDYPPLPGMWTAAPYHQMSDAELARHWAAIDNQSEAGEEIRAASTRPDDSDQLGKIPATKGI